jgi:hypothetical protein
LGQNRRARFGHAQSSRSLKAGKVATQFGRACDGCGRHTRAGACTLRKAGKELIGELLGGRINKPGAELGELAADLSVRDIGKDGPRPVIGEVDVGAALGEPGNAALALAGDRIALGRVDV